MAEQNTAAQPAKPEPAQDTQVAQAPANTGVQQAPTNSSVQQAPDPLERFGSSRERCIRMFGSENRFVEEATFMLAMLANTPALKDCNPSSINGVLLAVANTGLSLSPVKKEVYVIPRSIKIKTPGQADRWEKRAMMEPSYIGLMKVATDSGAVRNFETHDVYMGDHFDFDLMERKPRLHKPYWSLGNTRGKLVGVYGWAVLHDGTIIPDHMGADELDKIRSKSDNKDGSVYTDWAGEMARKSLLKRICKHIPRTEKMGALMEAIDQDNQQFDLAAPEPRKAIDGGVSHLMAECRVLLDNYTGQDKEVLRKKMGEEALTGRMDPAFWSDMKDFLTVKPT